MQNLIKQTISYGLQKGPTVPRTAAGTAASVPVEANLRHTVGRCYFLSFFLVWPLLLRRASPATRLSATGTRLLRDGNSVHLQLYNTARGTGGTDLRDIDEAFLNSAQRSSCARFFSAVSPCPGQFRYRSSVPRSVVVHDWFYANFTPILTGFF